jgi:hypothetical protein
MENYIENYNENSETVCGYTVYSYYIDGPDRRKKSTFAKKTRSCLRIFAFAALAPFALLADAVITIFN